MQFLQECSLFMLLFPIALIHWLKYPVPMTSYLRNRQALVAHSAVADRRIGIPFSLDNLAVLQVGDNAAAPVTILAGGSNFFTSLILQFLCIYVSSFSP